MDYTVIDVQLLTDELIKHSKIMEFLDYNMLNVYNMWLIKYNLLIADHKINTNVKLIGTYSVIYDAHTYVLTLLYLFP